LIRSAGLAFLLLAAACGQEGTIAFDLIFPAGVSRLPPEAATVRLRVDDPAQVEEAPVDAAGGFSVEVAVPGEGGSAHLTFEALDAGGAVLVRGTSPPLPKATASDFFHLYVAPPGGFSLAPTAFTAPRAALSACALPYGLLLVGGRDAGGAPLSDLYVYDVYTHELFTGAPLPGPRASPLLATAGLGLVYVFGGVAPSGPSVDLWLFDANAPPLGVFSELPAADPSLARPAGAVAPLDGDRFLLLGGPLAVLDGLTRTVAPLASAPPGVVFTTATSRRRGGRLEVVLTGDAVAMAYDPAADAWTALGGVVPPGEHGAALLPDGSVALAGGRQLLRIGDADVSPAADLPAARTDPVLAVAGGQLVVASGADADVFDAASLAYRATVPLAAARTGPVLLPLGNETLLLAGGGPAELEIFTP